MVGHSSHPYPEELAEWGSLVKAMDNNKRAQGSHRDLKASLEDGKGEQFDECNNLSEIRFELAGDTVHGDVTLRG